MKLIRKGGAVDSRLRLEVTFHDPTDLYVRTAFTDLYINKSPKLRDLELLKEKRFDVDLDHLERIVSTIQLKANFFGTTTVHNCYKPTDNISPDAVILLEFLASLHKADKKRILDIKLFQHSEKKLTELKDIYATLDRAIDDFAFFPYKSSRMGTTVIQYGIMKTAKEISKVTNSKGTTYTSIIFGEKYAYRNTDELAIHQGYSEY